MLKVDRYFQVGKETISLNNIQLEFRDKVKDKIQNGIYSFEFVDCGFCGSKEGAEIAGSDRYGLEFHVKLCNDCGGVYTSPRMSQESYNQFYNEEYRPLYVGTSKAGITFFKDQIKHGKEIMDFILAENASFNDLPKVIWEVGCGAGGILSVFKEMGHNVLGVDLGQEYVDFGKTEYGLNLITGTLQDLREHQTPDLIIYSHVMEHVLDLNFELDLLCKVASEKTLIYVEVPGLMNIHKSYGGDIMSYFQNAHVWHFTLTSLSRVFSIFNFDLKMGDEYVKAIFQKRNSNKKSIEFCNERAKVESYIKQIEKNRWKFKYSPRFVYYQLKTNLKKLF